LRYNSLIGASNQAYTTESGYVKRRGFLSHWLV